MTEQALDAAETATGGTTVASAAPLPPAPDLDEDAPGTDLVRSYLQDIARTPLLTAADEVDLAKRIEAGLFAEHKLTESTPAVRGARKRRALERVAAEGRDAKARMLKANLRLVVSVAKRYGNRGMPFLDIVQEGNLGLIRAVEKFDYTKGFKFSTYATWWIRQAITRGLAEQARTIRLPVHVVEDVTKLRAVERRLLQELGRPATTDEVADRMDATAERVVELRRISRDPVSLDMPLGDPGDPDGTVFGDLVEDRDAVSAVEVVERAAEIGAVHRALDTLDDREKTILELRFGIRDGRPHSLDEIGRELGLTRERIRQLEKHALASLRGPGQAAAILDIAS